MFRFFVILALLCMPGMSLAQEAHHVEHIPHVYMNLGGIAAFGLDQHSQNSGLAIAGIGVSFPMSKRWDHLDGHVSEHIDEDDHHDSESLPGHLVQPHL